MRGRTPRRTRSAMRPGLLAKGASHVENSHIKTPKAYTSVAVDLSSPWKSSGAQYARVVHRAALLLDETEAAVVSTCTAPPKSQNCGAIVKKNTLIPNENECVFYLGAAVAHEQHVEALDVAVDDADHGVVQVLHGRRYLAHRPHALLRGRRGLAA